MTHRPSNATRVRSSAASDVYKRQSEGLTRIYFQIDSWQTFMFNVQVKECFVEREHVNNDAIGENLIDEGYL